MNSAISAQNLEIGYKSGKSEISIARIPELNLEPGKLTCLLGANGVGKSTLFKTITGGLPALNGKINLGDQEISAYTVLEKARKLAVVLTDKAHLGFTTVREMILLGRNPYTNWMNSLSKDDHIAIEHALVAIGMTEYSDKPLAELSDGNLQKVIIGRAIAQETDIIILDEPTVHLDIKNKKMVIELLRNLCTKHGKTILLSTHDLELAKQYADILWLMDENKITQGLTEDLILDGVLNDSFEMEPTYPSSHFKNLVIQATDEDESLIRFAIQKSQAPANLNAKIVVIESKMGKQYESDGQKFTSLADLITHLRQGE